MAAAQEQKALFAGLISNQEEELVDVTIIGGEAFYVIPDGDFRRHVEAARVDEIVLKELRERITGMQDLVVDGVLQFLGKEDLFTKASVDMAIENFEKGFREADPNQWKPWLGMMGFKIIVNVHGEVVEVQYPEQPIDEI